MALMWGALSPVTGGPVHPISVLSRAGSWWTVVLSSVFTGWQVEELHAACLPVRLVCDFICIVLHYSVVNEAAVSSVQLVNVRLYHHATDAFGI